MTDLLAQKRAPERMTAAEVRAALKRRYGGGDSSAIVFEVAQSTGFNARRHLDAVTMGLWPSRGLMISGIEIKVDFYDWRRELKQPEKAEEIARFCDFFYVACPAHLIPINEVPFAWGVLEVMPDRSIREAKAPQKTEAQPLSREFAAALMRAATRAITKEDIEAELQEHKRKADEQFEQRVKERVEAQLSRRSEEGAEWRRLVEALGEDPSSWIFGESIVNAVKLVRKSKLADPHDSVAKVKSALQTALKHIEEATADIAIPETPADSWPSRRRRA